MSLKGKVALITGASRGIGRAVAVALAKAGAQVAVNFVNRHDAAMEVKREIQALGHESLLVQADVAARTRRGADDFACPRPFRGRSTSW